MAGDRNLVKETAVAMQADPRIQRIKSEARDIRGEHKRRIEPGWKDTERDNLAVMEHLRKEYSDACVEYTDKKGRLIMRPRISEGRSGFDFYKMDLYLTQEGLIGVSQEVDSDASEIKRDPSRLVDEFVGGKKERYDRALFVGGMIVGKKQQGGGTVSYLEYDLSVPVIRKAFKNTLEVSQKFGEEARAKEEVKTTSSQLSAILDDLSR